MSTGQKLGTYALTVVQPTDQQPQLADSNTDLAVFFGGKRILTGGGTFIQDRLGSARRSQSGAAMSFYSYGEDKGTTQPNDQLKFATYTRDIATGLDYADQRYYANNFGRFMSPDPRRASGRPADPQSWNRYAYVEGDPIGNRDPAGLDIAPMFDPGPSGYTGRPVPGLDFYAGGGNGCHEVKGGPMVCEMPLPINWITKPPPPPPPPPPDPKVLCEDGETAYIAAYLTKYGSPLAAYAEQIVQGSGRNGLDDRFIVALAGAESGYGQHLGWGPFNAWNNGAHNGPGSYYTDWIQAISDVIFLIGNDPRYTPYNSTADIYSVYERGDVNQPSPGQSTLDNIYRKQLGGNVSNVRIPRCP